MTGHERAVHWLTERVQTDDAGYRRDVALTTCELCREGPRSRRWLELLSLVALALRLCSRARTNDRPDAVWRQGVQIGAVLLLTSLATQNAAAGWVASGRLGLAAIVCASAICALLRRRIAAIGLAAGAAIVAATWVVHGLQAGAFVSCCAVAIGGLLAAGPEAPPRRLRAPLIPGAIMLVGLVWAPMVGASSAEAASVLAFAWVAPIVLLIAGWFDPRLAAAATTIVFARLAASGFGELGRALAVLHEAGQRELLVRWLAMSSGVVGAWLVTHRAITHLRRL
jgi:hypothetical protein